MAKRVTLKDIADRVGVSPVAVSAALGLLSSTTKVRLSPEVAQRIRDVSNEMAYQQNRMARAVRSSRTHTIGVLMRVVSNSAPINFLIDCIHRELAAAGYRAQISIFHSDFDLFDSEMREFTEWQVDGLIATYVFDSDVQTKKWSELERFLTAANLPVMFVNTTLPGAREHGLVEVDMAADAQAAVNHLLSLGHTHLAYVGEDGGDNLTRYAAARKAAAGHKQASIKFIPVHVNTTDAAGTILEVTQATMEVGTRIASQINRPTGLICGNDSIAAAVCSSLSQAGVNVPGDVSIIGYDNTEVGLLTTPALSSFSLPMEQVAKAAVAGLLARIKNPAAEPTCQRFPSQMVLRQSTAVAPSLVRSCSVVAT